MLTPITLRWDGTPLNLVLTAGYSACLVASDLYIRKGYSQDISLPPDFTLSPIGTENPFKSSCFETALAG